MYNLKIEGIRDFNRSSTLLPSRKIARDSLSGVADGSNVYFYTQYYPILSSGSLTVYSSTGTVLPVTSVDYDTGEVILVTAPSTQPKASYTFTPYNSQQIADFLIAGFDEMQLRWNREDWYVASGSVAPLTLATGTEDNIFLVKEITSSGSLTDPLCSGSIPFSKLRNQVGFYMACCEYAFVKRQWIETSINAIDMRESHGITLTRSNIPKNLGNVLDHLDKKVNAALKIAQEQYYSDGSSYGYSVLPIHSDDYMENFEWQSDMD